MVKCYHKVSQLCKGIIIAFYIGVIHMQTGNDKICIGCYCLIELNAISKKAGMMNDMFYTATSVLLIKVIPNPVNYFISCFRRVCAT